MAGTPAARLSVEIVAEIARLQKDLDAAKREVKRASQDIGRSAKAANDNIGRWGKSLGGVNRVSGAMRANMVNLSRQATDVAQGFALNQAPMQIFLQQGFQISEALAMMGAEAKRTNTSLTKMAAGGLARFGPKLAAAAAVAALVTAAVGEIRDEVNKTSKVTVTSGDVILGTFDAIAAATSSKVTAAFEYMGLDIADVWNKLVDAAVWTGNAVIGVLSYPARAIAAAWSTFPGAMADLFYSVVNAAVDAAEKVANAFVTASNKVREVSNEYLGTSFDLLDPVNLDTYGEEYAGKLQSFFKGQGKVAGETFTRDFIGEFADFANPFIQDRAFSREAERVGKATGRKIGGAAKKATQKELASLFDEAFAGLSAEVDELVKQLELNRGLSDRIEALRREAALVGKVGWERERLLMTMEHQAEVSALMVEIATAEAKGQASVVNALQARLAKMREIYDLQIGIGEAEEQQKAVEDFYDLHEDRVHELAGLYEDLFTGGVDSVWDSFKRQGISIISQIAAEWSLALISGRGTTGFGQIAGSVIGQSPFASIFGGSPVGIPANDNIPGATGRTPGFGGPLPTGGILPSTGGGFDATLGGGASSLLGSVFSGLSFGSLGSSIVGSTGTMGTIGGLVGGLGGQALGSTIAALGSFGGPLGAIVGGILGSVLGGALSSTKRGSAIINGTDITGFYGNSQSRKDEASGLAGQVFDGIQRIAEALGATVNASAGKVSIGIRKGSINVDPQGRGYTKTSKFSDIRAFGQDAEAAVLFAIQNLIQDGVIGGISAASQRILRSGQDLEAAIEKAVLIESVPKLLKERLDPLGAALDTIDDKFQQLADALREGQATAQQFADAEKLYNLERQDALDQYGRGAEQLRGYLKSLAFGSNSPLSIRSQLESARADFAQYEQAILAGEAIDQAKFTGSAQSLLGLSRQANASTSAFFADFDRVRELTEQAITNTESEALADGSVVFMQQTAGNTQSMALQLEESNRLLRQIAERFDSDLNPAEDDMHWMNENRSFA